MLFERSVIRRTGQWWKFARRSTLVAALILCFGTGAESPAQSISARGNASEAVDYYQLNRKARQLYERARDTYAASDFEAAIGPLEKVLSLYPRDGENWIRLGDSRYYAGDYRGAAHAYKRARSLGYGFLDGGYRFMDYSIAASFAQLGENEEVLHWLKRALHEERLPFRQELARDSAIGKLLSDGRIRKLIGLAPNRSFDSRIDGWCFDLDYLLSEITRLNATYSERSLPEPIQQAADLLCREIPSLTDGETWVRLQQLLAMLDMSHNSVWHFLGADRFEITQLPVTFYIFSDGLHIIDAEQESLIGARVNRIGSVSAEKAIDVVESVVTSETPMKLKWLGPEYLRMPQVLFTLGLSGDPDSAQLRLQTTGGSIESVTLKAVPVERRRKLFASKLPGAGPAPLYLSRPDDAYWFEYLPEDDVVYFQFNQIVNAEDEPLLSFTLRLRNFIKEHHTRNLIVDLRRNNGGDTFLYGELLRTLIWFDVQENRQLFVIIGRNTYSAAQNFATDIERLTEAVFVGEPSGGRPNGHGDEAHIVLPYSGLHVGLSSVYWQHSHPRDDRRGIAPDVPVVLTADGYFTNEDPAMNAIRAIIGEHPQAVVEVAAR